MAVESQHQQTAGQAQHSEAPRSPVSPTADHLAGIPFGQAIAALKAGQRVFRTGWNGRQMWLALQVPDAHSTMSLPYIYIEYPVGHPAYPEGCRVPWLASQTDVLAEDWWIR